MNDEDAVLACKGYQTRLHVIFLKIGNVHVSFIESALKRCFG